MPPSNGSNTCHPHQAEQPASGHGSRPKGFSAGAGHCEHEIRFVNACARLSRFSNSAAELFSVGRRGVARAAVCGRFPATRVPCQASSSNCILRCRRSGSPPIGRDRKQLSSIPASPTSCLCSRTRRLPRPPRRRSALIWPMLYDSRPLSLSEQADASDGSPAISTHVRETLAQLGPGVSDQAGSSRRRVSLASKPQRNFAQTRSEKRRRSARRPEFRYHTRMMRFTELRPKFL